MEVSLLQRHDFHLAMFDLLEALEVEPTFDSIASALFDVMQQDGAALVLRHLPKGKFRNSILGHARHSADPTAHPSRARLQYAPHGPGDDCCTAYRTFETGRTVSVRE